MYISGLLFRATGKPSGDALDVLIAAEFRHLDPHAARWLTGDECRSPPAAAADRRRRRPVRGERRCAGRDVVDAEADVVQAFPPGGEELGDRTFAVERLDELQAGVAAIQIGEAYMGLLDLFARQHGEAVGGESLQGGVGIADRDRDVVETADRAHARPMKTSILAAATASTAAAWRSCISSMS